LTGRGCGLADQRFVATSANREDVHPDLGRDSSSSADKPFSYSALLCHRSRAALHASLFETLEKNCPLQGVALSAQRQSIGKQR
jgi:hypothetical protein